MALNSKICENSPLKNNPLYGNSEGKIISGGKVPLCHYSLKKLDSKIHRDYRIYNPQALSSDLALLRCHSQGLLVTNSVDPWVLKSYYYIENNHNYG